MKNDIKISSIVIAKDEEKNIKNCIESQLNCIDEIIVFVDSKSKDKTKEIAESYSKVICKITDWEGYAKTKQNAADIASNDWIFWIDADETITKELSDEINNFKKREKEEVVFDVARRAYFLGRWIKHSGWYPGRVERLFNKNFVKFSENNVHEYLVYTGKVGHLKNDLNHFTDPSIEHYFEKFNRYTTLAAADLVNKKKSFKVTDIILRPFFIFIKMYFFKLGFLDGIQGFILASFSSAYVFTKYCKLWELKRN
jgi:glycosyltransferase involved in cell wall biosynthesis